MIYFSKTARNFFIILSLPKVDNISFHLNLVSQLAALVCTIGVHGNIGNSKQSFIAIYRQEHAWEDYLRCYISPKRLEIFFIILSLRKVNNISLHMNLVIQLAALVCQPGIHRNMENKSGDLATFWQKLPGHDILDVIFLQNGSKFFHDTFSRQSRQYFLSHEPSQPIGRAGLSAWRS